MLRESGRIDEARQEPFRLECTQINDWVDHCSRHGVAIRCRSWKRYQRQSARWHRQITRRGPRILKRADGKIWAWNSLLEIHRDGPYSFLPLTSEAELTQEARVMGHCVYQYGPRCAEGRSRIFSVFENFEPVATVELSRNGDRWEIAQVRGQRNQPGPPKITASAGELAEAYTTTWQKTPVSDRHNSWLIQI